jgi:proline dehydrogenase
MNSEIIVPDFKNTENAFLGKTDKDLVQLARVFRLMNSQTLVNLGASVGLFGVKNNLPFFRAAVKKTVFPVFCGGESLQDSIKTIQSLYEYNTYTVLDYGVEARAAEADLRKTYQEIKKAVQFAATQKSVPVVSTKLTGLVPNAILEKFQVDNNLEGEDKRIWDLFFTRIDDICKTGSELGVWVYIDAEESWIQESIDYVANEMMRRYNKEVPLISNTYQLYRTDRLQYLKDSFTDSKEKGYKLGAKLVRGAYMSKERLRASEKGYPSPIQLTKADTDKAYNEAIEFCVDHYEDIALCNATHNADSNALQAKLIIERGLPKDHPNLMFSQLLGMSDAISFNLSKAGFYVSKYLPYGKVQEVIPYLIRRASENSSVTGEMSRELKLIVDELERRKLV